MGFYYRSFLKNRGFPQDQFEGRPVIGICNTWSELNPCNSHFRTIAEHVRYGVLDAGGFPLEFPVSSLGEVTMRPTAMLYRNLAAMDVEEAIRAHPLDGVVLLMGCDKTTPALLMGAASADLPTIGVSGGPQLRGVYRGQIIGSGTNIISMSEQLRAGEITIEEFHEAEAAMNRSSGHCMTMGTASTMASMVEALGRRHAGERGDPRGRCPPQRARPHGRAADRRDGARGPGPVEDPGARGVRERDPHTGCHRRLDQRRRPSPGDRKARRHRAHARRFRRARPRRALPRRPDALGPLPDGGLLLRWRAAGGAADPGRARAPAQGCSRP